MRKEFVLSALRLPLLFRSHWLLVLHSTQSIDPHASPLRCEAYGRAFVSIAQRSSSFEREGRGGEKKLNGKKFQAACSKTS